MAYRFAEIKLKMEKYINEVIKIGRLAKSKLEALDKDNEANRHKPGCERGSGVDRSRTATTVGQPSHSARRQAPQPSCSGTRHALAHPKRLITAVEYKPLSPPELQRLLKHLPFPPDKSHPAWFGRCFDCFVVDHEPGACKGFMVCHSSHKTGHRAKDFPARRAEPTRKRKELTPQGPPGDENMPTNRPTTTIVHLHETPNVSHEIARLQNAIVVDARLVTDHHSSTVLSHFQREWRSKDPAQVSKIGEHTYLIVLPKDVLREDLLKYYLHDLEIKGYAWHPWATSIGSTQSNLGYKVWLRLHGISPHMWSLEQLTNATAHMGLIIDHERFDNRISIEQLDVLLATLDLGLISKSLSAFLIGGYHPIHVEVLGWIEQSLNFEVPPDPTSDEATFHQRLTHMQEVEMARHGSDSSDDRPESNQFFDTGDYPKAMKATNDNREMLIELIAKAPPESIASIFSSLLGTAGQIAPKIVQLDASSAPTREQHVAKKQKERVS